MPAWTKRESGPLSHAEIFATSFLWSSAADGPKRKQDRAATLQVLTIPVPVFKTGLSCSQPSQGLRQFCSDGLTKGLRSVLWAFRGCAGLAGSLRKANSSFKDRR